MLSEILDVLIEAAPSLGLALVAYLAYLGYKALQPPQEVPDSMKESDE